MSFKLTLFMWHNALISGFMESNYIQIATISNSKQSSVADNNQPRSTIITLNCWTTISSRLSIEMILNIPCIISVDFFHFPKTKMRWEAKPKRRKRREEQKTHKGEHFSYSGKSRYYESYSNYGNVGIVSCEKYYATVESGAEKKTRKTERKRICKIWTCAKRYTCVPFRPTMVSL